MQRINHVTFSTSLIVSLFCILAATTGYGFHCWFSHTYITNYSLFDPARVHVNTAIAFLHYQQYLEPISQKQECFKQMIVHCKKSIELHAKNLEAYCYLGIAFRALGLSSQAITAFNKAIELDGNYKPAYLCLAGALVDDKQFDNALSIYQQILKQQPDNSEIKRLVDMTRKQQAEYRNV